ncbi:PH domain-containing protein [Auraticoccus monumenti]|uniref:PH domain-containing protein n=1 Tax=Auraticoccus monumenti TaxID=675864 RepID=A0A1G7AZJ7_9ACTN|nr:PH domain-containing protein [Auraticoccus monumenti]SDE20314.1 PH domain-containing protein [Auraticoccus monumenti]
MGSVLSGLVDPQVDRHLIADEGEVVIDEVRKHWVAVGGWVSGLVACTLVLAAMPFVGAAWWLLLVLGLAGAVVCLYQIQSAHMDRFVITNMRVFRVTGIFSQHLATMPIQRILDIAVHKPLAGRVFGYGHFVFESAAQDQGLRDIRWVGRPDERDLTIQRVIQRSGVRRSMAVSGDDGAAVAAPGVRGPREQGAGRPDPEQGADGT